MIEYFDGIVIADYFIVVFLVAFWKSFCKKKKSENSTDYILAGRRILRNFVLSVITTLII